MYLRVRRSYPVVSILPLTSLVNRCECSHVKLDVSFGNFNRITPYNQTVAEVTDNNLPDSSSSLRRSHLKNE